MYRLILHIILHTMLVRLYASPAPPMLIRSGRLTTDLDGGGHSITNVEDIITASGKSLEAALPADGRAQSAQRIQISDYAWITLIGATGVLYYVESGQTNMQYFATHADGPFWITASNDIWQAIAAIEAASLTLTAQGGFQAGSSASTTHGAAIGNAATSTTGSASGWLARAQEGGAAGESAETDAGASIGANAQSIHGSSTGYDARTIDGSSSGSGSRSTYGGSAGAGAETTTGGSIGQGALGAAGFSGGAYARAALYGIVPIDAVQLGTGTNETPFSFKVYDYFMMLPDGSIPLARTPSLLQTNENRQIDWTLADLRLSPATQTNQPVTKSQLDDVASAIPGAGVIQAIEAGVGIEITGGTGPTTTVSIAGGTLDPYALKTVIITQIWDNAQYPEALKRTGDDGGGLTNLSGTAIQSKTISSNQIDQATDSAYRAGGSGGGDYYATTGGVVNGSVYADQFYHPRVTTYPEQTTITTNEQVMVITTNEPIAVVYTNAPEISVTAAGSVGLDAVGTYYQIPSGDEYLRFQQAGGDFELKWNAGAYALVSGATEYWKDSGDMGSTGYALFGTYESEELTVSLGTANIRVNIQPDEDAQTVSPVIGGLYSLVDYLDGAYGAHGFTKNGTHYLRGWDAGEVQYVVGDDDVPGPWPMWSRTSGGMHQGELYGTYEPDSYYGDGADGVITISEYIPIATNYVPSYTTNWVDSFTTNYYPSYSTTNWISAVSDPWSASVLVEAINGTATVTRASTRQVYSVLTSPTVVEFDTTTFASNGSASVEWSIFRGTNSVSPGLGVDTNAWAALGGLATDRFESLVFKKPFGATEFSVQRVYWVEQQ